MLRRRGEEVFEHVLENTRVERRQMIGVGLRSVWNTQAADAVSELIRSIRPDVLKVDNFFPQFSPSIFRAAKQMGVPTVLSVRNYRLICPSANLFRDGHPCTECVGKPVAWPGAVHRCYRGSLVQSSAVVASNALARARGVWADDVDRYIAVSSFVQEQLVLGGLPASKIVTKPNFIADTGEGDGSGGYALYVGRLTEEKGVRSMLRAWACHPGLLPLTVIGDGPLEPAVREAAAADPRITFAGRRPLAEVVEHLGRAALLIFPSRWYEPFGRSIVEAYSKGTPVIAAETPPIRDMIVPGVTGMLYPPDDDTALAAAVQTATADPGELRTMRQSARRRYLDLYTEDANYAELMAILRSAVRQRAPA